MFCRMNEKKAMSLFWMVFGVVSIVIGAFLTYKLPESQHNYIRFAGMLIGFGSGILGVGICQIVRWYASSPEKRKEREIEKQDERNIQVLRAAYTMAACVAFILFALMAFLFTFLGEFFACQIALGALYIDALVMAISYRVLQKKM